MEIIKTSVTFKEPFCITEITDDRYPVMTVHKLARAKIVENYARL